MKFRPGNTYLLYILCLVLALPQFAAGQDKQSQYDEARSFLDRKEYQKAALLYKDLYAADPANNDVYQEYLLTLLALKDFKTAEAAAKKQLQRNPGNPLYIIAMGNVYREDKKEKKAEELFAQALTYINGDDVLTQQMAGAFSSSGNEAWAVRTYERAIQITQNPALYSAPLARLYNRAGDVEKAIGITIEGQKNMPQMRGDETIESALLEIIGSDPEKQRKAQSAIIKLVNEQPENYLYTYLLTWIFSVQNNWDKALIQVQALERRNTDKGRLLMDFAANAAQKQQYEVAGKAYGTVIAYGNTHPRYRQAREGQLAMGLMQVEENPMVKKEEITALAKTYADFFAEYPDAYSTVTANDYALLEARYNGQVEKGIAILNQSIGQKAGNKQFIGNAKLQLGDYYIIAGQVWEAALLYAQVDKAFREDALGEEARFRNAKLSYYQHDFEQAQGQLSVLKASTSELIANDALFLSVLITENVPPDSNLVPLQRFAYADLLLFQNKDAAAEALLDSVATAFPKNPLADDILLLKAKIAAKHKDFAKAIGYLKEIVERYGKDVLADDALFRIAEINRNVLKNKEEARRFYEQLIIDYPGSSFIQQARKELKALSPGT
ncbi:MAG: tetratricopeptide repeat protein [Chitinophagaceae bacterium]|nr:tetratricopeptide repeat protein [Chitinophagaceae bacterium]